MKTVAIVIIMMLFLISSTAISNDISLRAGLLIPQGELKDVTSRGFSLSLITNLKALPTNIFSVGIMFDLSRFGEEEINGSLSKVSFTGGGVGIIVEPPAKFIKPFAELFFRIASIEQNFKSGSLARPNEITTKTKYGFQTNAGLKFSVAPKITLEAGGSFSRFYDFKYNVPLGEITNNLSSWSIFTGVNISLLFL